VGTKEGQLRLFGLGGPGRSNGESSQGQLGQGRETACREGGRLTCSKDGALNQGRKTFLTGARHLKKKRRWRKEHNQFKKPCKNISEKILKKKKELWFHVKWGGGGIKKKKHAWRVAGKEASPTKETI